MNIVNLRNKSHNSFHPNVFTNSNIISSPYEKVLFILKETIKYINCVSNPQIKLITDLDWVIKTISSHLLYSYEINDSSLISQLTKQNPDLKQFVDFVSEYNEQVIEMNKKNIFIGVKSLEVSNKLLLKPSFKLKRQSKNQKIILHNRSNSNDTDNMEKKQKITLNCLKQVMQKINTNKSVSKKNNIIINNNMNSLLFKNYMNNFSFKNNLSRNTNNLNIFNDFRNTNTKISAPIFNSFLPQEKYKYNMLDNNTKNSYQKNDTTNQKNNTNYLQKYSYIYIDHLLSQYNFNPKSILEKDFNIFDLKKMIGQDNVLPLMGKTLLEGLGLKNEKIISLEKLEPFLQKVSSQYLVTTLYHNSMHGADVTHTTSLFFLNSNAEILIETNVLDLLSIIIAALGHDIGHPGLTNNFQINALTEMAITYNDISCLENFHCSSLFSILKKDETNIFEKLSVQEFKNIRKRMISEILATDMANHKKIMGPIQEKVNEKEKNNENFKFLSGNEQKKFDEQQNLLDYFIHAADLGHNTKKFEISLKWVELLSEEFWLQGDKERAMNLPISFLCDRKNINIPNSQVGFIGGFVIPTYNCLITLFPTLNYTVENANKNISEWQKLIEEKRLKGWTPRGDKKEKENIIRTNVNKWKPEKINIK